MSEGSPNVLFAVADEPALPAASGPLGPAAKKRRGSGRKRDPVWELTTVFSDKRVVCNRCNALIHRYGIAKVERVRNHFERRADGAGRTTETIDTETVELPAPVPIETSNRQHKGSGSYGNKSGAFKRKFAHWLYATGKPFEDAENELLLSALKVLRGDVSLPTRHELENELLELEYAASKNKYYLESKTAAQDVNGELMADDVEAVMAKEKKAEFYGIVAPTAAALSKYTRERIQKKHPRCSFFHGCVSHALTLLLDDVTSILPWLERVQASVVELASAFHENRKLQVLLSAGENTPAAEFPVSSSVCASLEDVLKHEKELYTIVARRDFVDASTPAEHEKLKRVQDFVLGETFVQDLVNSLAILRPLQQHLKHFQEDRPPLSQVFPHFVELLTVYSSMEWVTKKEKALITSCVTERFNAIYGESHGVAYMLDPLYLGEALDARKKKEVEMFIVRFCEHEGHNVDILAQLEKYKALVTELRNSNEAYWQLLQSGAVTPTSSISPPPSFGAQSVEVHSRFNRALSPDKLQKLSHPLRIPMAARSEGSAVVDRLKLELHERMNETLHSVCVAFQQEMELAAQPLDPSQVDYDTYNDCSNMDTSPYFTQQMDRIILACHSNTSEQVLGSLVTKDVWLRPRDTHNNGEERLRGNDKKRTGV
uniref:BED-type domain-containing protein n=1 Tax=Phytophthora ramorum TaxID=164328 RepID=H3HDA0_PHYRM